MRAIERVMVGQRNLENAGQIDAVGIEPAAEVAVLLEDQALPVMFGHILDGNGFVVGIGDIVAEFDGRVGVVDVAQAIEAGIEGADEIALGIVDGGREPAFGVVAQLVAHGGPAEDAPDGGDDVDEEERECDVDDRRGCHVTQGSQLGIERNGVRYKPRELYGRADRRVGQRH